MRSEIITEFLNEIDRSKDEYFVAAQKVQEENKRQQDLLHDIEFTTNSRERNKLCTKLHKSRKERRYWKDIEEETKIISDFAEDPGVKTTLNRMKQMLGQLRKMEGYHTDRTYVRRIQD